MKPIQRVLLLVLPIAHLTGGCSDVGHRAPGDGPRFGYISLDNRGRMRVSAQDRCPVCGRDVADYARQAAAVALKDSRTFYFCCTTCALRAWLRPVQLLGVSKDKLAKVVAQDAVTGEHVDGNQVTWIAGSDLEGPVGPVLVAIKDPAQVAAFTERHGGKFSFRLHELTEARFEEMTGLEVVPDGR